MDDLLLNEIARDAGYGSSYRDNEHSSTPVLGDPTRRYLAIWMLEGHTNLVVSFAAGVYNFFRNRGHLTTLEVAELMSGVVVQKDSSLVYCASHFPRVSGATDDNVEKMAREMFDLIASKNLAYE